MQSLKKYFALTCLTALPITGYAAACTGNWTGASTAQWDLVGNWDGGCIPGSSAVTAQDSATFPLTSTTTIGTTGISPGLSSLIFNSSSSYTINFSGSNFIQFNPDPISMISILSVDSGSHELNIPLKVDNTDLAVLVNNPTDLLTSIGGITEAAASTSSIVFSGPGQWNNRDIAFASNIVINGNFLVESGTFDQLNAAPVGVNSAFIGVTCHNFRMDGGVNNNTNTGTISAGEGLLNIVNNNFVFNDGAVNYTNQGPVSGTGFGVELIVSNNFTFTNGTMTNTNSGAVTGGAGVRISIGNNFTLNNGSLTNINNGSVGVASGVSFTVENSMTSFTLNNGTFTNSNTNNVAGGFGAIAILNELIMNGGTLNTINSGMVTGAGAGAAIQVNSDFTLNGGTVFNNSSNGSNAARIVANNSIAINGGVFQNNDTVQTPTITVSGSGNMAGNGTYQDVTAGSTLQVLNSGFVTPGDPALGGTPGVMTIQGSYTQSSTGTLVVNIFDTTTFSQLNVTGTGPNFGVATVDGTLEVAMAPGATINVGDTYQFLQTDNGLTGTFSKLVNFNIPNLLPQVQYFPNFALLSFIPAPPVAAVTTFASLSAPMFASTNENFIRLGREMWKLRHRFQPQQEGPQGETSSLSPSVRRKPPMTFASTLPASSSNVSSNPTQMAFARFLAHEEFADIPAQTEEKQEQLRRVVASQNIERPWNFYFGPTGSVGDVLSKRHQPGADYWSAGALAGFDYAFSQVGLGFMVDYDHISARGSRHWGHFEIDQAEAYLYATYAPRRLPEFAVNAIVGGGFDWYDIHRHTGIEDEKKTAKGNPDGAEFDALIGLEYAFAHRQFDAMPERFEIVPLISAEYIHLNIKKYREHGAGDFDLKVHAQTAKSFRSTLGTRINYTWLWENISLTQEIDLAWQREYLGKGLSVSFSPFGSMTRAGKVRLPRLGRNVALGGLDYLLMFYNKYGIEASYDFEWNSLYHQHSFYLGCNFRF
ncbi:MAG: autotransporter domain-containing protein [Verrucomicrobia bacterium]|nr:autotransporter domain-containing protein [Verrucomicrobiota bacterium]